MFIFKESDGLKVELNNEQKSQLSNNEIIKNALRNEPVIAFDIYLEQNLIAFAMLRDCDGGFFLWDYAVDAKYQNQGYGTKILIELINKLKNEHGAKWISTTYKYGNLHAKHVYEKTGFIQTDIVCEDGIHEVNMILKLS